MKAYITNQNHLLKESVDRGSRLVPVYLYENNWQNYELYLHWHDEMEWIIMDKGSAQFTIEGTSYTLHPGDCLFISPRQLHSGRSLSKDCLFRAILVDLDFLSSKEDDLLQSQYIDPLMSGQLFLPPLLKQAANDYDITNSLNQLTDLLKNKPSAWLLHLKGALLSQLALLESKAGFKKPESILEENTPNQIALKQLLFYMKQHCHEKLTLDQLAAKMNFNPQYFCRYFKAATAMTPIAYLTLLRIEKAALMLHSEDAKVSEVCYECGFDNVSYFIRSFKRHKGLTPKLYAQQAKKI